MSLPDPSNSASSALYDSLDYGPRRNLRGKISDDFGDGECIYTRLKQCGFEDCVEFVAGENGIVALNNFEIPNGSQKNGDAVGLDSRLLEYRYSIIPNRGSEVDYLRISFDVIGMDITNCTVALNWRGEGSAKICFVEQEENSEQQNEWHNYSILQNKEFDFSKIGAGKSLWYIAVSAHTLSLTVSANTNNKGDVPGSISIAADAVFLQKNRVWNTLKSGFGKNGTGRIQPDQVLSIIEKAELPQDPLGENVEQLIQPARTKFEVKNDKNNADNEFVFCNPDLESNSISAAYIDVVVSQEIELFHGEDVILSTVGLFQNKVKDDPSYVSASLPEWMFLDQRSGDLMGTVPAQIEYAESVEFSIYAVDIAGNYAKAIIPVKYLAQTFPASADLIDHTFCEGSVVSIPTIGMFKDFGLDVNGLKFAGEGLPEGVSVNPNNGLVKGLLVKGTANDAPYIIEIIASDGSDVGSGISMQFSLDVTVNEKLPYSPSSSEVMKNLYRMNRECERTLAAGMVSEMDDLADGFSIDQTPLVANKLPIDIDCLDVPTVHLFTPDRNLYMQVRMDSDEGGLDYYYEIQMVDEEQLPGWIECSPDGFISIKCKPECRYIDLELIQKSGVGSLAVFDICVDTHEGRVKPVHLQSETYTEKQIRQLSTA